MMQLHQLGTEVLNYVIDGSVVTVHRGHVVHLAEEKAGPLSPVEQNYILQHRRLQDRDGDGQVFVPAYQRSPITAGAPVKSLKSLNLQEYHASRRIGDLLGG
jgi:hypothetical protein